MTRPDALPPASLTPAIGPRDAAAPRAAPNTTPGAGHPPRPGSFSHHLTTAHHAPHHPARRAPGTPPAAPAATGEALKAAMAREAVPASWENSLRFIVDHESGGRVGVSNHVDTARGLFQLTAAQYHLNPHGRASFGNAVEEAQGGIRYIQRRYQTADAAAAFWQRHKWY